MTCDLSAELYLPVELIVTCDQLKSLADSIFSGVLLLRREEKIIFNHFVTLQALQGMAM